jgi:hypothetical protein
MIGRKINQILNYERGVSLAPLAILEKIACALEDLIAKKIIRKISIFRKIEELIYLYNQARICARS